MPLSRCLHRSSPCSIEDPALDRRACDGGGARTQAGRVVPAAPATTTGAVTRPAVEPLPHMDALLDGTRGWRFFTKLDPHRAFVTSDGCGPRTGGKRTSGRSWARSSGTWCPLVTFSLMRVMNQMLARPRHPGGPLLPDGPSRTWRRATGSPGPRIRCAGARLLVWTTAWYTCRRRSSTCSRRCSRSPADKSSKCNFGQQELRFLGPFKRG